MNTITTVPDILRQVFNKIAAAMPAEQTGQSLFSVWQAVLGGSNRTEFDVLQGIADIIRLLDRLDAQVSSSKSMDDEVRSSAFTITGHLRNFVKFEHLNSPAIHLKIHCSKNVLGHLGMIGISLKGDFPEAKISVTDITELTNALKDIKQLVSIIDLPIDLGLALAKHVDVMLWWLSHPEMSNVQDLLERSGTTLLIGKQIFERVSEDKPDAKAASKTILDMAGAAFSVLTRAAGFGIRHIDDIEKLGEVGKNLLGK